MEDPNCGKYFLRDMAFLMNLDDSINELGDLLKFNNNNHTTYIAKDLIDFSSYSAKLAIGPGGIDEYGKKFKNALYCLNYKELFPKK